MGKKSRRKRQRPDPTPQAAHTPPPPRPVPRETNQFAAQLIPRAYLWLSIALVCVVTLATFWRATQCDFLVWDDFLNLHDNPYLNPVSWPNILHFWRQPHEGLYIPFSYTVWAFQTYLSRALTADGRLGTTFDPMIFHTFNVLCHLLNGLVVCAILRRLLKLSLDVSQQERSVWAAGLGALVFTLHPVQAEPVVWVTGMKDVLSGLLVLVAVWQYLVYAQPSLLRQQQGSHTHTATARRRPLHYGFALLAFGMALLTKPSAVIAVPIIAALDIGMLRRSLKQTAVALLPWALATLPIVAVTQQVQTETFVGPPLQFRPVIAGDAVAFYLWKIVYPLQFVVDYGRTPHAVLSSRWGQLNWLIPCVVFCALCILKSRRVWLTASAVFIAGLLPVLGFIPFTFQNTSTVADRYLYVPMLGIAFALAHWVASRRWAETVGGCCAILLVPLAIQTNTQLPYWQNTETLFTHALEVNPHSFLSRTNLGNAIAQQGRYEEAIAYYMEAVQLKPKYARPHTNLGLIYRRLKQYDKALDHYKTALDLDPKDAEAHNNYANLLAQRGKINLAIKHYREAIRLHPHPVMHHNLGDLLFRNNRVDEAITHLRQAVRAQPDNTNFQQSLNKALQRQPGRR